MATSTSQTKKKRNRTIKKLARFLGPAPNPGNANDSITSAQYRVWYFAGFGTQCHSSFFFYLASFEAGSNFYYSVRSCENSHYITKQEIKMT